MSPLYWAMKDFSSVRRRFYICQGSIIIGSQNVFWLPKTNYKIDLRSTKQRTLQVAYLLGFWVSKWFDSGSGQAIKKGKFL